MRVEPTGPARGTPDGGFTLIELLVSLTILALLMALMPGTLRLGRRAWETAGQMEQGSDALAALTFVERHVAGAIPLYDRSQDGTPRIAFSGSSQALSFVVPLDTGPLGGGLYRIEAGSVAGKTADLRITLYSSESGDVRGTTATEERNLASAFKSLRFRYFGAPAAGEFRRWVDQWPREDRLPDLVEIIAEPLDASRKLPVFRAEMKLRPMQ
jgi:general secretion pathway protein J